MTVFGRQLVGTAMQLNPTPAERIAVARYQTRLALRCLSADSPDPRAAAALLVDALDHIEAANKGREE